MKLTITGYSTALFSTWLLLEEYGVLFDAGDGVSAGLAQKSRKATHIFITHADRDHLGGLPQLYRLNARDGVPWIGYPQDCGSFPALHDFLQAFDPDVGPATWQGLQGDEEIEISPKIVVQVRPNDHVQVTGKVKSLDFTLIEQRRKLKDEFHGLPGDQIGQLRAQHGDDYVTNVEQRRLVGYSGDTPRCEVERWHGVEVLMHEATFLDPADGRGAHSNLPQVMSAAAQLSLTALVLTHFSSRYKPAEIIDAIGEHARQHHPSFPIFAILPGEVVRDVLATEPIWNPAENQ